MALFDIGSFKDSYFKSYKFSEFTSWIFDNDEIIAKDFQELIELLFKEE